MDGGYHNSIQQMQRDDHRDAVMREKGIYTMRFTNREMQHPSFVADTVYAAIVSRNPADKELLRKRKRHR